MVTSRNGWSVCETEDGIEWIEGTVGADSFRVDRFGFVSPETGRAAVEEAARSDWIEVRAFIEGAPRR